MISNHEDLSKNGDCGIYVFMIDEGLGVTFHVNAIQHYTSNRENEGH